MRNKEQTVPCVKCSNLVRTDDVLFICTQENHLSSTKKALLVQAELLKNSEHFIKFTLNEGKMLNKRYIIKTFITNVIKPNIINPLILIKTNLTVVSATVEHLKTSVWLIDQKNEAC